MPIHTQIFFWVLLVSLALGIVMKIRSIVYDKDVDFDQGDRVLGLVFKTIMFVWAILEFVYYAQ